MVNLRYIFLLISCVCLSAATPAGAQKQFNNWLFGNAAGICFDSVPPKAITGTSIFANEGCAAISNRQGKLIFYTDGMQVYDKNHQSVPAAAGLKGNPSSTQVTLIVPWPAKKDLYYVFTTDANFGRNGLCYSIFRISANGLPLVVQKNVEVCFPVAEKLTAVQHSNGRDFWIICHEAGNNAYRSYLLDSNGINMLAPVRSLCGVPTPLTFDNANAVGGIKASPDGRRLAAAILGLSTFEVYDFDPSSGSISNARTFTDPLKFANAYSVEFSPDSRVLYLSCSGDKGIYQLPLIGTPGTWLDNMIFVPVGSGPGTSSILMGPDGFLYIGRSTASYLSAIQLPTSACPACEYVDTAVLLNGRICYLGLPNTFHYSINPDFRYSHICEGDSTLFEITYFQYDSVRWDFGDSQSGPENQSFQPIQKHRFSAPGKYKVKLWQYNGGVADSVQKDLQVFTTIQVNLGTDTTFCTDPPIQLSAYDAGIKKYLWQDSSKASTLQVSKSGTYSVTVSDGNCISADTIHILFLKKPAFNLGPDTLICEGERIQLQAGPAPAVYSWQDFSTQAVYEVKEPGLYYVKMDNECGSFADSILIEDCRCEPFVPTAFSPGSNGLNDVFKAYGCRLTIYELRVFNRWGELVFKSDDMSKGWDGVFRGTPSPEGVYAWELEYSLSTRSNKATGHKKGMLYLMR